MQILNKFLAIAASELGVHENEKTHKDSHILTYDADTSLHATDDRIAWCSAFANWVVKQAGIEGTNSAAAKSWLTWGRELKEPVPGCIVVLIWGDHDENHHVGFYLSHIPNAPDRFICRGGNQHRFVCDESFPTKWIRAYRVPREHFIITTENK